MMKTDTCFSDDPSDHPGDGRVCAVGAAEVDGGAADGGCEHAPGTARSLTARYLRRVRECHG